MMSLLGITIYNITHILHTLMYVITYVLYTVYMPCYVRGHPRAGRSH